ncbi:MAG: right-handed parallel beta-helix repeat-containing protein [Alphaproteobacteria bacterium]|nr:right-handed parallel beta-helix repeat-containing protein [Alphaproteobacteria bacterium]
MRTLSPVLCCGGALLAGLIGGCESSDKADDTGPVDTSPVETDDSGEVQGHCGDLTSDETWTADENPHYVTCDVTVLNATLTITEGAELIFSDRAGLAVGSSSVPGDLVVEGTSDAPVRMIPLAGEVNGTWDGVGVYLEGEASLRYAEIVGAGSGPEANLYVDGAEVLVDHVTLSDGVGFGVRLVDGGRLHEDSTALTVTGTEGWSGEAAADQVHTLPSEDSSYDGNRFDGVLVNGATVETSVTWEDLGVPYVVLGNVDMEGLASDPAVLTVGPGAVLMFDEGRGLRLSRRGGESALVLGEEGADVVTLTALSAPEPGFWAGIAAYDGATDLTLGSVLIEWATGGEDATVYAEEGVTVRMNDVRVSGSALDGVRLLLGARFDPASADIEITGNERHPVVMGAAQIHTLPLESYSGNGYDAIGVEGEVVPVSVSWPDHGMPYVVDQDVKMEGITAAPAILTIEPNVELRFTPGSGLFLSEDSGASGLIIDGEPGREVVMTAEGAGVSGHWAGVGAYDGVDDDNFRISNTIIEWAGDEAFDAALFLQTHQVLIEDVEIRNSRGFGVTMLNNARFTSGSAGLTISDCQWPLTISAGWVDTVPLDADLTGNTFDYLVVHGQSQVTASMTWPRHSVPYWVEDSVEVGNEFSSNDITLTIEPGVQIAVANDEGFLIGDAAARGPGRLVAEGTASQPIVFTAAQAFQPGAWTGINFGPYCPNQPSSLEHVEVAYGGSYRGGLFANTCAVEASDVTLRDNVGSGIIASGGGTITLQDVVVEGGEIGLEARDVELTVDGLTVSNTSSHGVAIFDGVATLTGVVDVSYSGEHGVYIDDAEVHLDGLNVEYSVGDGVHFATTNVSGTISDALIQDNGINGVYFSANGGDVTISDTSIRNHPGYGIYADSQYTRPTRVNVTYANNALGDIGP